MPAALAELVAYTPHPRTLTDNGDYVEVCLDERPWPPSVAH